MRFKSIFQMAKYSLFPMLLGIFPVLFHYGNNASQLNMNSLWRMLIVNLLITVTIYSLYLILLKGTLHSKATAASIFLFFFLTYGITYDYLKHQDFIQIEHYSFLPFFVLLAIYFSKLAYLVNNKKFWSNATIILSAMIMFNVAKILVAETAKNRIFENPEIVQQTIPLNRNGKSPDIYFIIFDEFAGFNTMREYKHWDNTEKVDEFVRFLVGWGFHVIEDSHSKSTDSMHQMASRLNYLDYPYSGPNEDTELFFYEIADNQVMQDLKALGYTTVTFDETSMAYPGKPAVTSDYSFSFDGPYDSQFFLDDFGILVADNTMLQAFSRNYLINDPKLKAHQNMISNTVNRVKNITDIPSPKFIYIHLLLPHKPFMFDNNGNLVDVAFHTDWDYYLGNYNYALKIAEQMINNILQNSDSVTLPIIILQSDHGARNNPGQGEVVNLLPDYPEKHKTLIMNALFLPGFDANDLKQDMNPTNTFPVILNHYFGANIPMQP